MKKPILTQEQVQEYLEKVAVIKPWNPGIEGEPDIDAWFSQKDGSYITFVSTSDDDARWMADLGLTELQSTRHEEAGTVQIGWCESEQKWYGWSHRAYYGFGIGSQVTKGSTHFWPSTTEEAVEYFVNEFKTHEGAESVQGYYTKNSEGKEGVLVTWVDKGAPAASFNEYGPEKFGKGEWTATTLEEAKEMAIAFAKSVS